MITVPCSREALTARKSAAQAKAHGQECLNDALDAAIRCRDVSTAQALLEIGANPNAKDARGCPESES